MPGNARTEQSLRGLDRFVERCLKDWRVYGCAVGIVKGDRVIHAKGYGIADAKLGLPVTVNTKFFTASFGKTFTATLAAILVDEGRLDWDRRVRDYTPSFRMYDPVATERATLRDFLAHRTGMGSHDRLWTNSTLTRSDVLERLRYLEPKCEFRSAFEYSNLNYLVAGAVMEHVTGQSWEDMVRTRILEPAGMRSSFFLTDRTPRDVGLSTGYELHEDRVVPFLRSFRRRWSLAQANGPSAPAGSIFSDLGDMCRYVRMHMRGGRLAGRRIVSEDSLRQTHRPHMLWPGLDNGKELLHAFYGMGWLVQPYRGSRCVYSGGNGYGFGCRAAFFPAESLAVVVLTNQAGTHMQKVITHDICDRMLGLRPIAWNSRYLQLARRARPEPAAGRRPRTKDPGIPRRLQDYTGEYEHPAYGKVTVALRGKRLVLEHNGFPFRVDHDHDDVFTISTTTDYSRTATFEGDNNGPVRSVAIPFAQGVGDIVFCALARPLRGAV